jgi:hypothetical protein
MRSVVLISLLSACSAAIAEPVTVQVQSHVLALRPGDKVQANGKSLVAEATHTMAASIDIDGNVHYDCQQTHAGPESRLDTRAPRKEH